MDNKIPAGCLPFDLEKALAGAPLRTRDGRVVTDFAEDIDLRPGRAVSPFPFEALIGGKFVKDGFTHEGRFLGPQQSSPCDLFLDADAIAAAEEPTTAAPRDDGGPAFPHLKISYTHQHYPVFPHAPADVHYGGMLAAYASPTFEAVPGMSLRQHAAITLRVPNSGTDWLDDMIREARRLDAAQAALPSLMQSWLEDAKDDEKSYAISSVEDCGGPTELADLIAEEAFAMADAMLAARGGAA